MNTITAFHCYRSYYSRCASRNNCIARRIRIDPTGISRVLNLTQMGEIKEQLSHDTEPKQVVQTTQQAVETPKQAVEGRWM